MDFQQIQDVVTQSLKKELDTHLVALILCGSTTSKSQVLGWSDIDYQLIVDHLTLELIRSCANISHKLEVAFNIELGINLLENNALNDPLSIQNRISTKDVQSLFEASLYPTKILFARDDFNIISMSKTDIFSHSLRTFYHFKHFATQLSYRYIYEDITKSELRKHLRKLIKACFSITKFGLQTENLLPCQSKAEIISLASLQFSDFNFQFLRKLQIIIPQWETLEYNYLKTIYNAAIIYLLQFCRYFEDRK
jgi:hypothetical protein